MTPKDTFQVLTDAEASEIKKNASTSGRRPYSEVTKALLEGETVFLVNRDSYNTKTFSNQGLRLRTSRGDRNGVKGMYIWVEHK